VREIVSRSFYCPKVNETVFLIEYVRYDPHCHSTRGILSCSHQDLCALMKSECEDPVFPWRHCPACPESVDEREVS
jgi:hypothetical protein